MSLDFDQIAEVAWRADRTPPIPGGFEQALRVLLGSLCDEANLHREGRRFAQAEIIRVMSQRLQWELVADQPSRFRCGEPEVIVITGLPRTGSTYLHNLLAAESGTTVISLWEALYPFPVGQGRTSRRNDTAKQLWVMGKLSPEFQEIHPMTIDGPEECITLLQLTGLSDKWPIITNVPTYQEWLYEQEMTESYLTLRRFIEVLHPEATRIVLKSPSHLGFLALLAKAFPLARLVHLDREWDAAMASWERLLGAVRAVFTNSPDVSLHTWRHIWNTRMLASRESLVYFQDQIHLEFDWVREPHETVSRILHPAW